MSDNPLTNVTTTGGAAQGSTNVPLPAQPHQLPQQDDSQNSALGLKGGKNLVTANQAAGLNRYGKSAGTTVRHEKSRKERIQDKKDEKNARIAEARAKEGDAKLSLWSRATEILGKTAIYTAQLFGATAPEKANDAAATDANKETVTDLDRRGLRDQATTTIRGTTSTTTTTAATTTAATTTAATTTAATTKATTKATTAANDTSTTTSTQGSATSTTGTQDSTTSATGTQGSSTSTQGSTTSTQGSTTSTQDSTTSTTGTQGSPTSTQGSPTSTEASTTSASVNTASSSQAATSSGSTANTEASTTSTQANTSASVNATSSGSSATTPEPTISPQQASFLMDYLKPFFEAFQGLPPEEKTPQIQEFINLYGNFSANVNQSNPLFARDASALGVALSETSRIATQAHTSTRSSSTTEPNIDPDYIRVQIEANSDIITERNQTDTSEEFTQFRAAHEEISKKLEAGAPISLTEWKQYNEVLFNFKFPTTTTEAPTVAPDLLPNLRKIYQNYFDSFNKEGSPYLTDARVNASVALFNTEFTNTFAQANQTQPPVFVSELAKLNQMITQINRDFLAPTTTSTSTTTAAPTIAPNQVGVLRDLLMLNSVSYILPYLNTHKDPKSRSLEFNALYNAHTAINNKINPKQGPVLPVTQLEFGQYTDRFNKYLNTTTYVNINNNRSSSGRNAGIIIGVFVAAAAAAALVFVAAKKRGSFNVVNAATDDNRDLDADGDLQTATLAELGLEQKLMRTAQGRFVPPPRRMPPLASGEAAALFERKHAFGNSATAQKSKPTETSFGPTAAHMSNGSDVNQSSDDSDSEDSPTLASRTATTGNPDQQAHSPNAGGPQSMRSAPRAPNLLPPLKHQKPIMAETHFGEEVAVTANLTVLPADTEAKSTQPKARGNQVAPLGEATAADQVDAPSTKPKAAATHTLEIEPEGKHVRRALRSSPQYRQAQAEKLAADSSTGQTHNK